LIKYIGYLHQTKTVLDQFHDSSKVNALCYILTAHGILPAVYMFTMTFPIFFCLQYKSLLHVLRGVGEGGCIKAILWTACCCQKGFAILTNSVQISLTSNHYPLVPNLPFKPKKAKIDKKEQFSFAIGCF
jgi:hypothetical protein